MNFLKENPIDPKHLNGRAYAILNDYNIHVLGFTVYGTPTYLKIYCGITCTTKCGITTE